MRPKGTKEDLGQRRLMALELLRTKSVSETALALGAAKSSVSRWKQLHARMLAESYPLRPYGRIRRLERLREILGKPYRWKKLITTLSRYRPPDGWDVAAIARYIDEEFHIAVPKEAASDIRTLAFNYGYDPERAMRFGRATPGRPSKLTPSEGAEIVRKLRVLRCSNPKTGWTRKEIAAIILELTGKSFHIDSIGPLIEKLQQRAPIHIQRRSVKRLSTSRFPQV